MPSIFRIKRSEISGAIPANLAFGEIAFNFADHVLYIGDRNGNAVVVASAAQIPWLPEPRPETPTDAPAPTVAAPGYTTSGIRRRLLPFE